MQVVASDDDGALHLGGDAHALQNGTADAHIPGMPRDVKVELKSRFREKGHDVHLIFSQQIRQVTDGGHGETSSNHQSMSREFGGFKQLQHEMKHRGAR